MWQKRLFTRSSIIDSMDKTELTSLLKSIKSGKTDIPAALDRLKNLPFEDVVFAHIDHHRSLRHGMPEVIYCEGKTVEQIAGIAKRMLANKSDILATRASEAAYRAIKRLDRGAVYHKASRAIVVRHRKRSEEHTSELQSPTNLVC